MLRSLTFAAAALGLVLAGQPAAAQQKPVPITILAELSGDGTVSGTNYRDGATLAFKEINAHGGILGHQVALSTFDTQSNPGIAKALAQKAVDSGAYVVLGPVYSGSVMVSMDVLKQAEIPDFTGGEAAAITKRGDAYIFRTSFTQDNAMPRVARYMQDDMHVKKVAMIWVNNDFGKGGRDAIKKAFDERHVEVVADIPTDQGQVDFSAPVLKAKQANADAVFVYLNEDESARALKELRKQGYNKPIVGETTICSQKVVELAGGAANGAICHVGLTPDAPDPTIKAYNAAFQAAYHYKSDHNGMKGYSAAYIIKALTERLGKFDSKAFAKAMHGASFKVKDTPGVLMDVTYDDKGDLDRESFMVKVENNKQVVVKVLPPLGPQH
jgi:branched-chain amino acid transport system substrate-binding protein